MLFRSGVVELKLVSFSDRLGELPPLEIDQLMHRVAINSIVVEAGGRATVVSAEEVFPVVQAGQAVDQVFAGEEAVTAALLRLTVADRPVAMFVKPGGRLMSERLAEFKTLIEQLRQSNFVIENWDLSQSGQMPRPESNGPIVLVVMVPDQVNPQYRMPPVRPEEYGPVLEFLKRGGDALFLTQGSLPNQPVASLPYEHVIEAMGLKVRLDLQTVRLMETTAGRQVATPFMETTDYPSAALRGGDVHAIVRPLQGLRGRFDWTLPIVPVDEQSAPAGLKWWPLLMAPQDSGVWGESNVRSFLQGEEQQFDAVSDLRSPFAVAVAASIPRQTTAAAGASEGAGEWAPEVPGSRRAVEASRRASQEKTLKVEQAVAGPHETRVVVFGGDQFIRSGYLDSRSNELRNYPANVELFINSMYWLSGHEEMIGLGPQAQQSRRLGAMGESRTAILWLLWLGMPVAVLLIGGIVWYSRRR